jgi:DNA-binding MarR family transcriptional regulator
LSDAEAYPGSGHRDDEALAEAGAALFRLGRLFARRPAHADSGAGQGRAVELSRILVAEAVAAGSDTPEGEVTVGVVAGRLVVDPSTASRLVAEAIREGYVARGPSSIDARRSSLHLTASGAALVAAARRYQSDVFAQITADWTAEEQTSFARLLARFTAGVAARLADSEPAPER